MRKIILMMPVSAGGFLMIIGIFGRIGGFIHPGWVDLGAVFLSLEGHRAD